MSSSVGEFVYPDYFDLPPFFTIQPVLNTKKKQFEMWRDLILQYFRVKKLYELDINEPCDIFTNEKINRKLSVDGIREIVQYLIDEGYGEWKKHSKDCARIYWRKPTEWASIIYKWVRVILKFLWEGNWGIRLGRKLIDYYSYKVLESGLNDTVCTLYELREGESAEGQEFYGLDNGTLIKALRVLEKDKKAQIFKGNDAGSFGVKFF